MWKGRILGRPIVRVLILCVNYYTESHIEALTRSLIAQKERSWLLAIVDNGSSLAGASLLRALTREERVILLHPRGNLGYFGAAQWGYRTIVQGESLRANWVVVCNPDICFSDVNALRNLNRIDSAAPVVIAPAIIGPHGDDQNPFMSTLPSRKRSVLRFLLMYSRWVAQAAYIYVDTIKPVVARSGRPANDRQHKIFAGHGSCIFFSAGYFDRGLDLSHPLFLFGEEVVIGTRCRRENIPIVYDPRIRAEHSRHASFGRVRSRAVAVHQRRAAKLIYRELRHARAGVPREHWPH